MADASARDGAQLAGSIEMPSRISSVPGHADYDPYWSPRIQGVWLNGVAMPDVVRLDMAEGWIEIAERDEAGQIRVGAWCAMVVQRGEVRVKLPTTAGQ